jgi:hypothetical protein
MNLSSEHVRALFVIGSLLDLASSVREKAEHFTSEPGDHVDSANWFTFVAGGVCDVGRTDPNYQASG